MRPAVTPLDCVGRRTVCAQQGVNRRILPDVGLECKPIGTASHDSRHDLSTLDVERLRRG
jgi:hypothetical protein